MRLRLFASRVIHRKLRTLLLFTSESKLDDMDEGGGVIFGRPLLTDDGAFEEDACFRIMPEMAITFDTNDNEVFDEDDAIDWNFDHLTVRFELYYPESHNDAMTEDQLLRYLEYCLPWPARPSPEAR